MDNAIEQNRDDKDEGAEIISPPQNGASDEDMVDLTMNDHEKVEDKEEKIDDDDIEVIPPDLSDVQALQDAPSEDVVAAFNQIFGNQRSLESAAENVIMQDIIDSEQSQQQEEDEDDDPIIEHAIVKSEEDKLQTRKSKTKEFLSWFIRVKPEQFTNLTMSSMSNYLEDATGPDPVVGQEKSKEIAKAFKDSDSLEGLAEKFDLENGEVLIAAICIGVLEDDNELDIDFGILSDERVDNWSISRITSFLDMNSSGVQSSMGPLKLMQFTVSPPASVILLLTVIWLTDNNRPCRFRSGLDPLADHLFELDATTLADATISTSLKYWNAREEPPNEQINRELDEFFCELETTASEFKENMESLASERSDILKSRQEGPPNFDDEDEAMFLSRLDAGQRENLAKVREQYEAMKKEIQQFIDAHNEEYNKKNEIQKLLVLQPGDFCLARTIPDDDAELTYAIVQELVNPMTYKVKFIQQEEIREVNIRDLALTHIGMYDPVFSNFGDVGVRVAVFQQRRSQYELKSVWLSGTTAGRRHSHKGDFLVFLDNGTDTYVTAPTMPTDEGYKIASSKKESYSLMEIKEKMAASKIAIMVGQPLDDKGSLDRKYVSLWLRNEPKAQYLQSFMKEFPEWPLLRMPIGMRINLMNSLADRRKNLVTVVGNDRVFAIVRFEAPKTAPGFDCLDFPCTKGHQHRDEKVYRGSHRLEGAAHKKNLILKNNNLSKRRKDQFASQFEPTDKELTMPTRRNLHPVQRTANGGSGTSTVRKTVEQSKEVIEEKKRKQNLFTRTVVPIPVLPDISKLKQHDQCGPDCLQKMDADPYDEKFHRNSPLHTPLMCGWRRVRYTMNSGKKRATYKKLIKYFAPCGKPLDEMSEVSDYLRDTRSMLTIDCFSFEEYLDTSTYITVEKKYVKSEDLSNGLEGIPIPLVNSVDSDPPPELDYCKRRFQYNESVVVNSIHRDFCSGCSCDGDCSDASKCECQQLSAQAMERLPSHLQYDRHKLMSHYKNRVRFNKVITGVYECNDQCSCNRKSCHNRVVQNNIKYPMQIFKTAQSGWGCRALTDIPEGAFICNYVGALLTDGLANQLQNDDEYFADLDLKDAVELAKTASDNDTDFGYGGEGSGSEDSGAEDGYDSGNEGMRRSVKREDGSTEDENTRRSTRSRKAKVREEGLNDEEIGDEGNKENNEENSEQEEAVFNWDNYFDQNALYVVDAKVRGNLGRFLNHSCAPNVQVQHVLYDTHDLRLPWVAFFTIKHVKAGEELCWDYSYTFSDVERIACKCGAPDCRRRLL